MRYLLPFLLCLTWLQAANVYIREGGSGAGTSWSDALDDLPSTFVRGNVYYVADGSYGSHTFSTATSGTSVITIKKATEADHGTETGWSSAYGDGQAAFDPEFAISTSYWIFDGQVGGGIDNDWATNAEYGFRVRNTNNTSAKLIRFGAAVSNVQFSHIDFSYDNNDGRSYPDATIATSQDAVYSLYSVSDTSWSYCRFNRAGRTAFLTRANWSGITIEYCYFRDSVIGNQLAQHGEIWSANHFGTGFSNITIRYNWFERFRSTGGLIFSGGNGVYIYGNVFNGGGGTSGGNGAIGNWSAEDASSNVKVHNNTFVDMADSRVMVVGNFGSGREAYNNLFIGNTQKGIGGAHDYNAGDYDLGETNDVLLTSAIFTNYASEDFTLASATGAGSTLGSPYTADMTGETRGADGSWDRGAFEFVAAGGGDETAPTPDPMTFSAAPAGGEGQVSMTASTASDASTPVQYYFDETTGGSGATDSGWQSSTSYTDTGLSGSTEYTYRVKARDSVGNETAYSSSASATTDAAGGVVGTPTFDPAAGSYPGSSLEITLTASGAEYVTYSLDDADPEIGVDPQIANGASFELVGNAAVRIIGHADGLTNSEVVRGFFSFTGGEPQDEPGNSNRFKPQHGRQKLLLGNQP